jgi:hypothetical protein
MYWRLAQNGVRQNCSPMGAQYQTALMQLVQIAANGYR